LLWENPEQAWVVLTRLGQRAELGAIHFHFPNKEASIMSTKEYKQLGCLDVQPSGGCGFQVRAETEGELMQLVATHAKQCHKLDSIPAEMVSAVKAAIKTVSVTV
jgi:predicted small metal-binding protein